MPNALAQETSPYLLQHASNPVDWRPWGRVALDRARDLDRPLLVSIGYSACHWCHVMERESFEDPDVARLMNEWFVCVKVDREERPDIDAIYMEAVQAMTGQGGWPLNVFLTPDQLPFYGGTYFPPERSGPAGASGMPTWPQVLRAVADAWRTRREELEAGGGRLRAHIAGAAMLEPSQHPVDPRVLKAAVARMRESFDERHGGFGGAPKFPPSSALELLLARGELHMSLATLRAMAAGGIHDQVAGGFHRYSVDTSWTVPHFEKMLYDNALLSRAYLHAWQLTGEECLLEVCRDTLDWALREMRGPEGAFFSALDADSEGVEGAFYVWTLSELREILDTDAEAAIAWFGASTGGNFQDPHHPLLGLNVLEGHGPAPDQARRAAIRERLLAARERRPHPARDEKRITSWNALMICALADAGAVLQEQSYLQAARACASFLLSDLRDPGGRLLRTHSAGRSHLDAYLEDHAFLLEALLVLYEASFEERWFTEARSLAGTIIERFADRDRGGFFSTADDHEQLIARRKDIEDAPIPSGSSSAVLGLLRLAALTGEPAYEQQALSALSLTHELADRHPLAFGHLLQAIDFHVAPTREVALVGASDRGRDALEAVLRERPRPHLVLAAGEGSQASSPVPLLAGRTEVGGRAAAYVCEGFTCKQPVTEPAELAALLDRRMGV